MGYETGDVLFPCDPGRALYLLAQIDWGTAPAWSAVVAAGIAAVFAYRSNRNQQAQLKHQQDQLDRQDDEKRREQASKVAAWVYSEHKEYRGVPNRIRVRGIRIANDSGLPIFVVGVRVYRQALVPDGPPETMDVVPPGLTEISLPQTKSDDDELGTFAMITFLDAQGAYWVRDTLGRLTEIDDERHEHLLTVFDM